MLIEMGPRYGNSSPSGSAGGGTRESRPLTRPRALLRRFPRVRSAVYFASTLRLMASQRPATVHAGALAGYEPTPDPWGYGTGEGRARLAAAERMIERAAASGASRTAVDLGCGEGYVSEVLARHSERVLGTDLSPIAVDRAKARCEHLGRVSFRVCDFTLEPPSGPFDLVVLSDVLEIFVRPWAQRRVRQKAVAMVAPGGHLLLSSTKQAVVTEESRWALAISRGSRGIARSVERCGLGKVAEEETATHRLTLFRKPGKVQRGQRPIV